MQKTVREWLHELTEPYKSQALENIENPECYGSPDEMVSSLYKAVDNFTWRNTRQGHKYWREVSDCIFQGIPIVTSPTERQTAEALLKEFGDWFNSDKRLLIHNDAIQDFITSKYGKG